MCIPSPNLGSIAAIAALCIALHLATGRTFNPVKLVFWVMGVVAIGLGVIIVGCEFGFL